MGRVSFSILLTECLTCVQCFGITNPLHKVHLKKMTRLHLIDTKLCKVDTIPVLEMKIEKLMRLTENKFLTQGQSLNHQKGWIGSVPNCIGAFIS